MATLTAGRPDTLRSIYYALGANLAVTIIKFLGAAFTARVRYWPKRFIRLPTPATKRFCCSAAGRPGSRHPRIIRWVHGRATNFWSFIVSLVLFMVGGVVSIVEGYYKLRDESPVESPWVAIAIVLFAMIAEAISLRTALQQIAKVRGDLGLYRWFRETRRSELIVILGEDLAAIAGLGIALVALLATIATGSALYDALGSICIGVLLVVVASGLAIETKSLLIGESASPKTRRAIQAFLDAQPRIVAIHDLLTVQQGEQLMIAVQAQFDPSLTAHRLLEAISECKAGLRKEFPEAAWIFFEPMAGENNAGTGPRRRAKARKAA
jgi:divalent metal cation (Fe/Co/Zn/Cd) transporter